MSDHDQLLRCAECGAGAIVGIEDRDVYDGILFWYCLRCCHAWPRFSDGRLAAQSAESAARWHGKGNDEH